MESVQFDSDLDKESLNENWVSFGKSTKKEFIAGSGGCVVVMVRRLVGDTVEGNQMPPTTSTGVVFVNSIHPRGMRLFQRVTLTLNIF